MLSGWRIVPALHSASAFTGDGARQFGGRWNSVGTPMVYSSSTISLAALETLVHINPQISVAYVLYEARFDASLAEKFPEDRCSPGWDAEPPGPASMAIGDEWFRKSRSVVLSVPSVLTGEMNYLLNPKHPDFKLVKIGKPEPFAFDLRLVKK
jgi:RES domain-containing protein